MEKLMDIAFACIVFLMIAFALSILTPLGILIWTKVLHGACQ